MNHLMACRVCLAYDIRLHSISGGQLRDIYEKFTETSLETGDTKPTCVCYICFSLLKKFQKFVEKSKKSDQLLEQMLNFGLELTVNSLELFRQQLTGLPWTLGKTRTVRVISATEEEVKEETPIKTEYVNSEMDLGDQNEDDLDGIPLEDTNQDSSSDSEDNMPLQNISKQWKVNCLNIKSKVRLKRSKISEIETSKILKPDAREIILSKEELQQMLERSKSQNYQNSPFKCDLCFKGFVDTKAFENHQEKHDEVLHLPKKRKADNDTEKEIMKRRASFKKTDQCAENKAHNEDNRKTTDFNIRRKKLNNLTETIIPNNETTTSNINSDIKISKINANSNEHFTDANNDFKCDLCKKIYISKSFLENHIKKWHVIDPNVNYQNCKNTNLLKGRNVQKNNLVTENKLSENNKHKKYKICSYCSKKFDDGANFTKHVRIHTGEKPYKCSYCTKCFSRSSHLATHVRIHTGEKPYNCSYCTKCFAQSGDLAKHLRIHTGEKPFKCSYCTKCFSRKGHLVIHIRTHTREKPYKCSYCTKCFTTSSDLDKHVRIHTGEKPYKCSCCTKSFTQSGDLTVHVKTHTGEKPQKTKSM